MGGALHLTVVSVAGPDVPTILRGICKRCGHETASCTPGYSAVLVDDLYGPQETGGQPTVLPYAGAGMPGTGVRLVILAHPGESWILQSTGYTFSDLLWQGRYAWATEVVCRRCGNVFPRWRLKAPPGIGCLWPVVAALCGAAAVALALRRFEPSLWIILAVIVGWGFGMITAIVIEAVAWCYLRSRFRDCMKTIAAQRTCPSCGADDAVRVTRPFLRVTCPGCRQKALRFRIWGIS
jgi:hypothetical protein